MSTSLLSSLESQIERLTLPEQLVLMESLAKQIRTRAAVAQPANTDWKFEEMSRDPHIQREIREINAEFACTEMDGLDDET